MAFRPVHGVVLVGALIAGGFWVQAAMGPSERRFELVRPDANGQVVIPAADLAPLEVRFYRFLNAGNQEVRFFVGRDEHGLLHVAFDAAESDYKMKRGFRSEGGWVINNKCDTAVRLSEVSVGRGGCAPVPLRFVTRGDQVVLAESDLLQGWRYFR
jgi:uncharacterized membrane protein